jgi:cytochrome oxidase assembly protein ShyY1
MKIRRMNSKLKKFGQGLLVLLLASSFIALGIWQLHRAQDMKTSSTVAVDTQIYPLTDIASSNGSLPPESIGKIVSTSGHYIANFKAPNQKDGQGRVADWDVALLQNETDTAILVVRGLWKDRPANPEIVMSTNVEITGTLLPHQNDDRAENTAQQLSRLDSSLLTGMTQIQLFDGFILEKSESTRSGAVTRTRIETPVLTSGVPGFYWQHISYVAIWWLMALVILWLPFYSRRGNRIDS